MYLKRERLHFMVTVIPTMNQSHSLIHLIIAAVKLRQKPCLNTFSSVCESGETTFVSSYLLEYSNETPQPFVAVLYALLACLSFQLDPSRAAGHLLPSITGTWRFLPHRPFPFLPTTAPPALPLYPRISNHASVTCFYRRG